MMLIGCLEREFLKNGLNSDVNSKLKSDLIAGNNFRNLSVMLQKLSLFQPLILGVNVNLTSVTSLGRVKGKHYRGR